MANEESKRPFKPFNDAATNTEKEITFEPDFEDNLLDNTDLRQEPTHKHHLERTPSGTNSVFKVPQKAKEKPETTRIRPRTNQPASEERQKEFLTGDYDIEEQIGELRIRIKLADAPSSSGINGGRISKMAVTSGERGKEVEHACFNDGDWEMPSETALERQSIMEVMHKEDSNSLKKKQDLGTELSSKDKGDDFTR